MSQCVVRVEDTDTRLKDPPHYSLPQNSEIKCFMCTMLKNEQVCLSHLFHLTSHFVETHATLHSWVHRVWRIMVPSKLLGILDPFKMKAGQSLNIYGNTHPTQRHSLAHINPQQFCHKNQSCKQVIAGKECTCNLTFCEGIFILKQCIKIHY